MAVQGKLPPMATSFFILLALLPSLTLGNPNESADHVLLRTTPPAGIKSELLHRSQFPKDFIFGVGSSAYQVEGGASEGGKGMSIWDTWAHVPGHIQDGSTGDVAVDQYHRYEEDIDLIADMNMDSYRFSIAWTRIFPNGTGPDVNAEGVAHYSRVIDAVIKRGLKPFVTLYHWDLPQALEDSYDGWVSDQSVVDFAAYAKACFVAFGDRVKLWTTFNEPGQFLHGYGVSPLAPPGRTSKRSTEPYIAAHHVLLAHAAAVDVYRREFQAEQKGEIGMTVECEWGEPLTDSQEDIQAALRHVIFQLGWFLDPLYFGDYPAEMRELVGSRLPTFSEEQVSLIKGSLDFIGLNYYTSRWVTSGPGPSPNEEPSPTLDQHVNTLTSKDGVDIGPTAASLWLLIVPWGMHRVLKWTWERYNAPIFATENGMDYPMELSLEESLHDTTRMEFYHNYISSLLEAVRDGVNVRGYYSWSLTDNFEWSFGYGCRFGLIYIDYNDNLKRYPKDSARWFSQFLQPGYSDS
ncbi:unnamed protein product [Calypogeia fissa]